VILKPMSPAYLLERVMQRLDQRTARIAVEGGYRGSDRRRPSSTPIAAYRRISDNVVQLFPHSWQPNS
jgi:hypothetical protein